MVYTVDTQMMKDFESGANGFASLLGIQITSLGQGGAEGEITLQPKHFNGRGTVHGGCIFALMDTVGGMAARTLGSPVTTSTANINFLRGVVNTQKLRAVAKMVKGGRTLIIMEVEAFDDADALMAKSTMTFFRLAEKAE